MAWGGRIMTRNDYRKKLHKAAVSAVLAILVAGTVLLPSCGQKYAEPPFSVRSLRMEAGAVPPSAEDFITDIRTPDGRHTVDFAEKYDFAAMAAAPTIVGCATAAAGKGGRILFGACRPAKDAKLMASVGYDFFENGVGSALAPDKDAEWWKRQKDMLLALPIPLRSCNGFIPGSFRLTGPKADFAPALNYAETALRRAEEVGVKTVVFGSSGARNVPGDYLGAKEQKPDVEEGVRQYTEFCRQLCARVGDLKNVCVVIEPLRPNESNIINFVWQGVQVCEDVNSPKLCQLAQELVDLFFIGIALAEAAAEKLDHDIQGKPIGMPLTGIRPAIGYPSLPDLSINFLLDELLDMTASGMTITENGAMIPLASVSGLMIPHPKARYFSIGTIGEEQFRNYARRRQLSVDRLRPFLRSILNS